MPAIMPAPEISVVIPVFNEAGNVGPLMAQIAGILDEGCSAWEVLWIDDASSDGTLGEIQALQARFPRTRALALTQHAGQSAALWAGLTAARGSILVTLDGDGQNDPRDIPRLLAELPAADLAIGFRKRRRDSYGKRIFSRAANGMRNWLTGSRIPDSGCSLRAFRREVLDGLLPFQGMHRFLPTLAEIGGWRVAVVEVEHHPRRKGRSKYGICDRLLAPLVDCLMLGWLKRRRLARGGCRELTTGVADKPAIPVARRRCHRGETVL